MSNLFQVIPDFLRNPRAFYESVQRGEDLKHKVFALGLSSALYLAIFGFVLGLSDEWRQALSSAVKLPLLFMATGIFCLPALYFFSLALLGTPLRMLQVTVIVLCGFGVTAFLLLGLAPVTVFFVLTTENYGFFQLLAVACVAISGIIGLYFLWNGMTQIDPNREGGLKRIGRTILVGWLFLYAFVSAQMTWRLSPFVGDPDAPFVLVRPSRDNFYVDVLHAIQRAVGLDASAADPFLSILLGLLCMGGIVVFIFVIGLNASRGRQPKTTEEQKA